MRLDDRDVLNTTSWRQLEAPQTFQQHAAKSTNSCDKTEVHATL